MDVGQWSRHQRLWGTAAHEVHVLVVCARTWTEERKTNTYITPNCFGVPHEPIIRDFSKAGGARRRVGGEREERREERRGGEGRPGLVDL